MLTATVLRDAPDKPLLILGPSLGTSVSALWSACVASLRGDFHIVGWDLPGHGSSAPVPAASRSSSVLSAPGSSAPGSSALGSSALGSSAPDSSAPASSSSVSASPAAAASVPSAAFGVAELARWVIDLVDAIRPGEAFCYAGVSLGGATGLQLLLDFPDRVSSAALICTGAKIGSAPDWDARAATVRAEGTSAVVEGSITRWFAPGFPSRHPDVVATLVDSLRAADDESYAQACGALAGFDVRARLPEIASPVLAVAGAHDKPAPPAGLELIASSVKSGRLVVLDDVAHLAPAELPSGVAALLDDFFGTSPGLTVRRAVLGDAHVDRAESRTTPFTRDFQDFITGYAWGGIWTRPGLDRRSRSMITLTALVALGHQEELAMHVRAAITNGLTADEIKEVLLQAAVYCGVPAANTAFRIAQQVLSDLDG